jgi:hypothetical protein
MGACVSYNDAQGNKRRQRTRSRRIKSVDPKCVSMNESTIKKIVLENFEKYDTNGEGTLDKYALQKFFQEIIDRKGLSEQYDSM